MQRRHPDRGRSCIPYLLYSMQCYFRVMGHASLIKNIYIHTHTHIYSQICYNEQILSIISGCYNEHRCHNERGGIISVDVTHFFFFQLLLWKVQLQFSLGKDSLCSSCALDCLRFLLGEVCSQFSLRKYCLCFSDLHVQCIKVK